MPDAVITKITFVGKNRQGKVITATTDIKSEVQFNPGVQQLLNGLAHLGALALDPQVLLIQLGIEESNANAEGITLANKLLNDLTGFEEVSTVVTTIAETPDASVMKVGNIYNVDP